MLPVRVPPKFRENGFDCPQCLAFSHQVWSSSVQELRGTRIETRYLLSTCQRCSSQIIWDTNGNRLYPLGSVAEPRSPDIPEDCQSDYDEASAVLPHSPRSAAALLRLVVQKLMKALGEKGRDLNEDIGSLVAKGLPVDIQQMLDGCRVIGNNAVHPGELDLKDDSETALSLFGMVNSIVDNRISQPKRARELYEKLPQSARDAITKRDK